MNTDICPIIKLVNQKIQDMRDIFILQGQEASELENQAYMALCNAKFHLVHARALLQERDMKRAG